MQDLHDRIPTIRLEVNPCGIFLVPLVNFVSMNNPREEVRFLVEVR